MTLTNLKTVLKTAQATSVKLSVPADRIGLGFGTGHYPTADSLSQEGRFPTPPNPEPEPVRSRQEFSAMQMRKQMRTDGSGAVPPAGSVGLLPPGSPAARVWWSLTVGESCSVSATDHGRDRLPEVRVVQRVRIGCDCQSPDRTNDKRALLREAAPATAAGK